MPEITESEEHKGICTEFAHATERYAQTAREILERRANAPFAEYQKLFNANETARLRCEKARHALTAMKTLGPT
jgi:hypothetical protein